MPSAETLAVLRDMFVLAMIALALGAGVYALLRQVSDNAWNLEGNVLTRPYGTPDAIAALLLLVVVGAGFFMEPVTGGEGADGGIQLTLEGIITSTVFMLLVSAIVIFYLSGVRGLNPAEMFGLRQMTVKHAVLTAVPALIITVMAMSAVMGALMAWNGGELPDSSSQDSVAAFENNGSPAFRIMLGFMAVITAPLTEELIFRGFLYGVVKRHTDRWFAAVFTALIFAVVHVHVGTAPQLFLLGLGLAIAYEHSGCLLVPMFMHAMFNAWNVAMLTYAAASS